MTPELKPETSTGTRLVCVVPSPSRPLPFQPQHLTPPELKSAQLCSFPVETALTPELKPETATEVDLSVEVPSPICPLPFLPQHLTAPVLKTAQLCVYPDEIALTPELKPVTAVGVSLVVFVPSPSSL
jgi:hypothetical protein